MRVTTVIFDNTDELWQAVKVFVMENNGDLVLYDDSDHNVNYYDVGDVRFDKWFDWYEGEGAYINRGSDEIPIHVFSKGDNEFEWNDIVYVVAKYGKGYCPECYDDRRDGLDTLFFDDAVGYKYECLHCGTEYIEWYEVKYSKTERVQ